MGRRDKTPSGKIELEGPRGFDDFDLKLGDQMRGERATLGKSLLDVQRDLKIKASYIAAIENADIDAFETKGFIAGYVRSYSRYLGMDPEWAYETFCREAGFAPVGGLDKALAKPQKPVVGTGARPPVTGYGDGGFGNSSLFAPPSDTWLSRVEPGAIGSTLVMITLLAALGYGGWSVLREVQQVRVTPVDQAPAVISDLDPVEVASAPRGGADVPATGDALNRLYRPQALDVPVMTPRDGPIAALDPSRVGVLPTPQSDTVPDVAQPPEIAVDPALADAVAEVEAQQDEIRVLADAAPEVILVAVEAAWVRVRDADGSVLLERTLQPGDSYVLPQSERPATLRAGAAGNVYFMVNGETFGPAGARGAVVSNVALSPDGLTERFARVDPQTGGQSAEAVRVAEAALLRTLGDSDAD